MVFKHILNGCLTSKSERHYKKQIMNVFIRACNGKMKFDERWNVHSTRLSPRRIEHFIFHLMNIYYLYNISHAYIATCV
jgi:hypothetical protein